MNIGIIGAGHIGGTLTRRFSALGHKVFVANSRGPESLADLANAAKERAPEWWSKDTSGRFAKPARQEA